MPRRNPTPHINAINTFTKALSDLLEVSERDASFGDGQIVPRRGQEAVWQTRRSAVDRAAPGAARALIEAGVGVNWKPPGTWNTYPINPAVEWATILTDYPKFDLNTLAAVCNQAIGSLETGAFELATKRPGQGRVAGLLADGVRRHGAAFAVTVAATVAASWVAFRLGWVG